MKRDNEKKIQINVLYNPVVYLYTYSLLKEEQDIKKKETFQLY